MTDADGTEILEVIRRSVAIVVPEMAPAEVTFGRTLAELGCNSIDRAEIVTLAMEALGMVVPVTELAKAADIASLVALLRRYV